MSLHVCDLRTKFTAISFNVFVTIQEMWAAQGLFKCNFENQEAVQSMWEQASKAQDLAGNAFASTCMQAKIIASLVHGQGWINLAGSHGNATNALQTGFESGTTPNDSSSQPDFFETPDAKGTLSTASSSERGIKRKSSSDDDDVRDESVYSSPPAEASASSRPQKRISLSSESIVASSQLSKTHQFIRGSLGAIATSQTQMCRENKAVRCDDSTSTYQRFDVITRIQ